MRNTEPITKRLHVSGLTPQISAADLRTRFSSFGTVKALDELGKLDAFGQPRPFAYVTLETTKPQLAKCLNLLSGTMWKGAKLRIGEAKPDFRERIRREKEAANDTDSRPSKRRRLARGVQGVHADDMSLVTPTSLRPGWRVTPLGRLIRPVRIRPLRPLPAPLESASDAQKDGKKTRKRKKKNIVLVRARRKKIDPEEWGSTYLSGIMLEGGIILPGRVAERETAKSRTEWREPKTTETRADGGEIPQSTDSINIEDTEQQSCSSSTVRTPSSPVTFLPPAQAVAREPRPARAETGLAEEAARSLALLDSLFGSAHDERDGDDEDWGGAETLSDLDVDMNAEPITASTGATNEMDDGIEYVPRNVPIKSSKENVREKEANDLPESHAVVGDGIHEVVSYEMPQEHQTQQQKQTEVQTTNLKDIFAPRPEDAGFSILNNLDLDLELDEDLPVVSAPPPPPPEVPQSITSAPITQLSKSTMTFDPKRPFFFPHSLLSSSSLNLRPDDPRDIFSRESKFYRTESDEEIRRKWEERKVDLTREWKRRHREAVKSARRRGGAMD